MDRTEQHAAAIAALDAAEAAERAATPGPWIEDQCNMHMDDPDSGEWYISARDQHDDDVLFRAGGYCTEADVHLTRAARNAYPALLAGLREALEHHFVEYELWFGSADGDTEESDYHAARHTQHCRTLLAALGELPEADALRSALEQPPC